MQRFLGFGVCLAAIALILTGCGGGAPDASITSPANNATLNSKAVTFQAQAQGQGLSYTWDFGDGAMESQGAARMSHTYDRPGSYTVKVKAVTSDNKEGKEASITITVNNANPVAEFSADRTSGEAPLIVSFDASASTDADGQIATFQWDFGDGTVASGPSVRHTYEAEGSYTATLTVTDNDNGSASKSQPISVTAAAPLGQLYEVRMMATEDGRYVFDPAVLKIEPGDTVRWINVNQAHTSTSYSTDNEKTSGIPAGGPSWDSPVLVSEGETWEFTFPTDAPLGSYPYFCMPHEALGQVGIIVVGEFSELSEEFINSLSGMTLDQMRLLVEQARAL